MKNLNSLLKTKTVLCIMGPTASGKSHLAEELINFIPIEIINVDSALIYRHMNIGTAKPDQQTRQKIKHHLIDICDPSESYSAAKFVADAVTAIMQVHSQHKIPVLVGGTMMYYKALLHGLSDLPSSTPTVRQQITEEINQIGLAAAHDKLKQIDPLAAQRIHPNDPQRLQRALEVFYLTGKTLTELQGKRHGSLDDYTVVSVAIAPTSREKLHQRIEQRFHQMVEQGFIDEVKALYQREDLNENLPAIRAVGYRQAWQYLSGEISYEEMIDKAIIATRQLAKRQMTWLRSWENLIWLDSDTPDLAKQLLAELLT